MLAYIFERFPKFSQTFCYREVAELFRQNVRPYIFSLRPPELGGEEDWDREIVSAVHQLPQGNAFAALADEARHSLSREAQKLIRRARGRHDSLRLHQAAYIGARLDRLGVRHVHTHFAGMAARTAYWIKEFFGTPFSVTVHANDIFVPNRFEIGLREIFSAATAIVAVSDFAVAYLREHFPEVGARIHRVYNGIELARFMPTRFPEPPLVLSVGRLINKKGFDVLIDACADLPELHFRCEIAGDGPVRQELQTRIARHNLRERVFLTGTKTQSEIAARLAEASAFALPSRVDSDGAMDNLPTVIMEAMASALPIIATGVGGVPEMVRHGETGVLVPQNDAGAVAKAVRRLLENRALARELGARGRERCAEMFSLERNVEALRNILL